MAGDVLTLCVCLCVCVCRMGAHNNDTVPQKHCRVCRVKAHIVCLPSDSDNNLIMTHTSLDGLQIRLESKSVAPLSLGVRLYKPFHAS